MLKTDVCAWEPVFKCETNQREKTSREIEPETSFLWVSICHQSARFRCPDTRLRSSSALAPCGRSASICCSPGKLKWHTQLLNCSIKQHKIQYHLIYTTKLPLLVCGAIVCRGLILETEFKCELNTCSYLFISLPPSFSYIPVCSEERLKVLFSKQSAPIMCSSG